MALYEDIRSKIARQELELDVDSRNFKQYSARVKYLPENVEKPDFFSLCCGVLKPGDMVTVRTKVDKTKKEESYDVIYKFLVLYANADEQKVDVLQLKKVDMLNPIVDVEIDGIDPEELNKAITAIVDAKVKALSEELVALKDKFEAYTTETDDQLADIETALEELAPVTAEDETAE